MNFEIAFESSLRVPASGQSQLSEPDFDSPDPLLPLSAALAQEIRLIREFLLSTGRGCQIDPSTS